MDSGAAFLVLPHTSTEPTCGPALHGADGSWINCWGRRQKDVVAAGRRFSWNFLLANVAFPILGSDFLAFFKLILDFSGGVLFNKKRSWVCKLAAPAAAAEFSVVVPVGRFDQEWSGSTPTGQLKITSSRAGQYPVYLACHRRGSAAAMVHSLQRGSKQLIL